MVLGAPFLLSFLEFLPRAQHVHGGQGLAFEPLAGAISLAAPWLLGRFGEPWLGLNPFRFLPYMGLSVVILALAGIRPALARPGGWALVVVPAFLLAGAYGIPPVSWLAQLPPLDSLWWAKYQGPTVLSAAVLAGMAVDALYQRRARAAWLLVAVMAVELFVLMPRERPVPFNPLPPVEYVEILGRKMDKLNERVWGAGRAFMPHAGAALGIPDARTYFAVYPKRDYWYVRGVITGPAQRANDAVFTGSPRPMPSLASPGLSALSAGWIVATTGPGDLTPELEPPGELSWLELEGKGRSGRVINSGVAPLRIKLAVPPGGAEISGRMAGGPGVSGLVAVGSKKIQVQMKNKIWTVFRVSLPAGRSTVEISAGGGWALVSGLELRAGNAVLGADGRRLDWMSRFRREYYGTVLLMENRMRLPRARLVGRAVRVTGPEQALYEASADPAGGRLAFVEGPADWIGFTSHSRPQGAKVVEDSGSRVVCDVPGGGVRVLVLADTFEPGWRAYAQISGKDGSTGERRLRVLPADCMFRAVAVPPETHRVVFRYEPVLLKLGLLLSGWGLGLCLLGLAPISGPYRLSRSGA